MRPNYQTQNSCVTVSMLAPLPSKYACIEYMCYSTNASSVTINIKGLDRPDRSGNMLRMESPTTSESACVGDNGSESDSHTAHVKLGSFPSNGMLAKATQGGARTQRAFPAELNP